MPSDDVLLVKADRIWSGWNPALAGIEPPALPHPTCAVRNPDTREEKPTE